MSSSYKIKDTTQEDWFDFDEFDPPYTANTENTWDSSDVEITQVVYPSIDIEAYNSIEKSKQNATKRKRHAVIKTDKNRIPSSQSAHDHKASQTSTEWSEIYAPTCISDLAVTIGRAKNLTNFIEESLTNSKPAIVCLIGPPGSGKSTTVKVVANLLGVHIVEWINTTSTGQDDDFNLGVYDGNREFPETQTERFKRYLYHGNYSLFDTSKQIIETPISQYRSQPPGFSTASLSASCIKNYSHTKKILLVDDIPNVFLLNPNQLHDILRLFLKKCRHILIFIVSSSDMPGDAMKYLFPDSIFKSLPILEISFLASSDTSIKKVIRQIMELKASTSDAVLIDDICEAAGGDIRCAINLLQFQMAPDCAMLTKHQLSRKYNKPKKRKTSTKQSISSTTSSLSRSLSFPLSYSVPSTQGSGQPNGYSFSYRNQFFSTFHLIGKCFSAKRLEWTTNPPSLPSQYSSHARLQLYYDPGLVFENSCLSTQSLLGFLQGNYIKHFLNIEEVYEASAYLSLANTLSPLSNPFTGTPNHYSPYIAMLGISHSITQHTPSQSMVGHKSQESKLKSVQDANKTILEEIRIQLPVRYSSESYEKFAYDTLPYLMLIQPYLMLTQPQCNNETLNYQLARYSEMNISIFSKGSIYRNNFHLTSNLHTTTNSISYSDTQEQPYDHVSQHIDAFEDEANW